MTIVLPQLKKYLSQETIGQFGSLEERCCLRPGEESFACATRSKQMQAEGFLFVGEREWEII